MIDKNLRDRCCYGFKYCLKDHIKIWPLFLLLFFFFLLSWDPDLLVLACFEIADSFLEISDRYLGFLTRDCLYGPVFLLFRVCEFYLRMDDRLELLVLDDSLICRWDEFADSLFIERRAVYMLLGDIFRRLALAESRDFKLTCSVIECFGICRLHILPREGHRDLKRSIFTAF